MRARIQNPRRFQRGPWGRAARAVLRLVAAVALLAALSGCGERIEPDGPVADRDQPSIPYPVVERDLDQIRESGILRMITHYSSSGYFIHKGGQAGFDYELVQRFAQSRGLTLEVVIPQPGENPISLLNSGRGDLVCGGLVPHESLEKWVSWTRPTNFAHKVVVLPASADSVRSLQDLAGLTLVLPDGDPFRHDLVRMRNEADAAFYIHTTLGRIREEELLVRVARGEVEAAVVNDIVARAAMAAQDNLQLGPVLGGRRPVVWLVRQNTPELKAALDEYLRRHLNVALNGRTRRSQTYGIIYDRYYENPKTILGFREAAHRPDISGKISEYDEMIQQQAEPLGLDWRMVAALIYQESRFYPYAQSKAGARGLMQVLPQFAGVQSDSLFIPEANLRAGLRLMANTYNSYAYLDSLDRWCFTLAEYHAGFGHLTDARRLAMDLGRNPNKWEGSLVDALPHLARRKYFQEMRHGYYGGHETVKYVKEILDRYRTYMRLVPRYQPDPLEQPDLMLPTILNIGLKTRAELENEPPPAE